MVHTNNYNEFSAIKQEIQDKKIFLIKIVTDSMEPLLQVGHTYTVIPVDIDSLSAFDIILFWQKGRPNAHFYWGKHSIGNIRGHMTRSLKLPAEVDPPIKDDEILGKVIMRVNLWHKTIFLWRYLFPKF